MLCDFQRPRGLQQAEPEPSISRLGNGQGCLSRTTRGLFFSHFYHDIGIEHIGQIKLKFYYLLLSLLYELSGPRGMGWGQASPSRGTLDCGASTGATSVSRVTKRTRPGCFGWMGMGVPVLSRGM